MLDYNRKILLKSWDNRTFDGSCIHGFTAQRESDLRLGIDWGASYMTPGDVFGSGKVLVFGDMLDKKCHDRRAVEASTLAANQL